MFNLKQLFAIDKSKPHQYGSNLLELMVWLTAHDE